MTTHQQQTFVLVPSDQLERLSQDIRELQKLLKGATVTPEPDWVTPKEAARKLCCDQSTIHRWIASGRIEAKGSGKLRRVRLPRDHQP